MPWTFCFEFPALFNIAGEKNLQTGYETRKVLGPVGQTIFVEGIS